MQLVNLDPKFTHMPFLTKPIQHHLVETLPFKDFDKDGYEVPTPLEHLHYEANNVELNREIQYHIAPVQEWYHDIEQSEHGLVLDHCMLLTRYAFAGEARQQLQEVCNTNRPILQKLLNIKPKWGIDFSLDYVTHNVVMEVIHIEQDFDNVDEAQDAKERLEAIIQTGMTAQCVYTSVKMNGLTYQVTTIRTIRHSFLDGNVLLIIKKCSKHLTSA